MAIVAEAAQCAMKKRSFSIARLSDDSRTAAVNLTYVGMRLRAHTEDNTGTLRVL
jgi:hypothetical protein